MLELTVRLIFSLAVVIGLLLLIARFSARRFRSNGGATIQVVHRQALTRTSAVSVLTIGGRVLVIGSTEQQISLLAELDPDDLDLEVIDLPAESSPDDEDTPAPALGLAILDSPRTVPVPEIVATEPDREIAAREAAAPMAGVRRGAHKAPGLRKAPRKARPAARRTHGAKQALPEQSGPNQAGVLTGSILSPDTWRQAVAAARRAS